MPLAVFDIDGTLTDTNVVDEECYDAAIRQELGLRMPTYWPTLDEITDAGILHFLGERQGLKLDGDDEHRVAAKFLELLSAAFAASPERFRPIQGARKVFGVLRDAGWKIAIATGGWRPSALFKLQSAGIPHEDVPLATSSEHRVRREIIKLYSGVLRER